MGLHKGEGKYPNDQIRDGKIVENEKQIQNCLQLGYPYGGILAEQTEVEKDKVYLAYTNDTSGTTVLSTVSKSWTEDDDTPDTDFEEITAEALKVSSAEGDFDTVEGWYSTNLSYTDALPLPLDRYYKFQFMVGTEDTGETNKIQFGYGMELSLESMQYLLDNVTSSSLPILVSFFSGDFSSIRALDIPGGRFQLGTSSGSVIVRIKAYKK